MTAGGFGRLQVGSVDGFSPLGKRILIRIFILIFFNGLERRLKQQKWVEALQKFDILPQGKIDHFGQLSC
jgi:hypothetical protein